MYKIKKKQYSSWRVLFLFANKIIIYENYLYLKKKVILIFLFDLIKN